MLEQFLGWCTEKAARSRLAPRLSVLLACVVWTHAEGFGNVAFWVIATLMAAYQIRAVDGRVKA